MRILKLNFLSLVLLSIMVLGVSSCKSDKKNEVPNEQLVEAQAIYKRSIEIHDEVMPKMKNIRSLTKQLEQLKDSMSVAAEENVDHIQNIDNAIGDLKSANDAMQDWMVNVEHVPNSNADSNDAVSVQKTQENEIEQVQDQMETSIKQAENLLATIQSKK